MNRNALLGIPFNDTTAYIFFGTRLLYDSSAPIMVNLIILIIS